MVLAPQIEHVLDVRAVSARLVQKDVRVQDVSHANWKLDLVICDVLYGEEASQELVNHCSLLVPSIDVELRTPHQTCNFVA